MDKKVIPVSFKNNDREQRLYEAVINSYNKSAFTKECIEFYLDNKDKLLTSAKPKDDSNLEDVDWEF